MKGRKICSTTSQRRTLAVPEALNRVRVDGPDHVLLLAVVDSLVREFIGQGGITAMLVGGEKRDLIAANDADKCFHVQVVGLAKDPRNYIALALNSADHGNLGPFPFLFLLCRLSSSPPM